MKRPAVFVLFVLLVWPGVVCTAWAGLNDLAVYVPATQGWMTPAQQKECADYIEKNVEAKRETIIVGHSKSSHGALETWISANMDDGESDVLIIINSCPAILYGGEPDGSLAETWMDCGNMIIWTGSEPFSTYIDQDGGDSHDAAAVEGASRVLDVSSSGLCRGVGMQEATSAAADYRIEALAGYNSTSALRYDRLLIDSLTSDWHHMSYWRVDEVFAESSESYCSDNIVLVNDRGGQFAQFFCVSGELAGPDGKKDANYYRMRALAQFLNNWVSLPSNTLVVPDDYPGIQKAIDCARPRDTVLVRAGVYNEQLRMKKGVKVVSDKSSGGDDLVRGPGYADTEYGVESKQVLRRAQRTIIDGTGFAGGVEAGPMIDFPRGATVAALLDGFSVRNMPRVNHTLPGHAHTIQCRGASATIINNIVHDNGSSGMGSHAWFRDEHAPVEKKDFRHTNIEYDAHPIIINNVVYRNEGNNLGNNHYAYAIFYNNECFESISIDDHDAPGIGNQHGAHALIVGNLVYRSDWVGIGARKGEEQGVFPVDRPTHPVVRNNRVYDSGQSDPSGTHGAGIGADNTGGYDPVQSEIAYHIIEGNYVDGAQNAAIGCRSADPDLGYVKIIGNDVLNGGRIGKGAGIALNGVKAAVTAGNICRGSKDAGICIRNGARADLIEENQIFENGAAGIAVLDEVSSIGEIRKNMIRNNARAGIRSDGPIKGIYNNIICGNGAAGIACFVPPVEIANNVVAYNDKVGIANWSPEPITIRNNICYRNRKRGIKSVSSGYSYNCLYGNNGTECSNWRPWCYFPQYSGQPPGRGALPLEPMFVDPEKYDFRLAAASPCIDSGDHAIVDADGTRSDMGAYGGPDPMVTSPESALLARQPGLFIKTGPQRVNVASRDALQTR